MPSTIQVKEKTVNNREVISFSKTYADEEHEVFAPEEQGVQVLLNLLSILNDGKDEPDQFVLIRKRDVGGTGSVETVENGDVYKRQAVGAVVESFFDGETANEVQTILENYSHE